jgi:hypothetical protein
MPYRGEEMPQENGCWQLDDWGFMAEDGGLLLAYDEPGAAVVRGICTEIPRSARVEFSIRVNSLSSLHDIEPAFVIGFVPSSSPSPENGDFLLIKLEISDQEDAYVKYQTAGVETYLPLRYTFGEAWRIVFLTGQEEARLFVNGNELEDALQLPTGQNALWIGYSLHETTQITAFLSELTIEER